MKTITFLLSAVLALCWLPSAAQTKYYQIPQTFYESGYTYQCDIVGLVFLYNKANKWTYEKMRYKATGKIVDFSRDKVLPVLVKDNWTRAKCAEIVTNAFSYEEALRVQQLPPVSITMYVNPATGKVDEVMFIFANFNAWATIPVSVFRKIEVGIKSQVWFTPTDTGKTFNYILTDYDGMPKPIAPASTTTSTTPSKPIKPTPPTNDY
jgi:hypothetical protein